MNGNNMNNITFKSLQKIIIVILFFSQLLFSISFGKISSFYITIPFAIMIIFYLISILGFFCGKISFSRKRIFLSLVMIFIFFINVEVTQYNFNLNSFCLYIFYFFSFALIDNRISINKLDCIIKMFITILSILSLYGIYQFIAYNFITGLSFKEIIPDNIMVGSYNTIQYVHGSLFGLDIVKAHSIFAEASGLSKYAAIALLLTIFYRKKLKLIKFIFFAIINFLALIFSLSGSGFIIIILCLFFIFLKANVKNKIIILVSLFVMAMILSSFSQKELYNYYLNRFSEFSTDGTSGYYRFILPFKIGIENLKTNFFGFGIGNDDAALFIYNSTETGIANGYGKIFVELGIIGLLIFIIMLINIKPKNEKKINEIFVLYSILISLLFTTTILNPSIWAFILFIEVSKQKNKGEKLYEKNIIIYD